MNATIKATSLIIRCEKCNSHMNLISERPATVQCDNDECGARGNKFTVSLPKVEVELTIIHDHNWPNGMPRYDEKTCPACKAERGEA